MGWLRRREDPRLPAAGKAIENLTRALSDLQREVSSLSGRLRACENTGHAVNSRCERVETRIGKLERQSRLPGVVWRAYAPGAEDAEPPTKPKTCATCRGARVVDADPMGYSEATCPSCGGRGHVEAAS